MQYSYDGTDSNIKNTYEIAVHKMVALRYGQQRPINVEINIIKENLFIKHDM